MLRIQFILFRISAAQEQTIAFKILLLIIKWRLFALGTGS